MSSRRDRTGIEGSPGSEWEIRHDDKAICPLASSGRCRTCLLLQGALAAPCAAHGWKTHVSKTKTVTVTTVTTTTTKTCGTIAPVAVQPVAPTYAPAPVAPTAYVPAALCAGPRRADGLRPRGVCAGPRPCADGLPPRGLCAGPRRADGLRPRGLCAGPRRAGCLCPCGLCPGTRGPGGSRCTSTSCAASPDTTGLGPALGLQVFFIQGNGSIHGLD